MKTLTAVLVAAALLAPAAADAGTRINTPGTEARHEANLTPEKDIIAPSAVAREIEPAAEETEKRRPRAALAGKVNLATKSRIQ